MADVCTGGVDTGFVALGYVKVAVLGVVQGITELLPISSTAHMRVVPALLGWQDPGSAFSAAMQLAALAAVVSYFWKDVTHLISSSLYAVTNRQFDNQYFRLSVGIVLATIPIVIAGWALAGVLNTCHSPLRSLSVIGWACIVMAILLALAELYARHQRTVANASLTDAITVGMAQEHFDSRGVPLWLDLDRGPRTRLQEGRGSSLFFPRRIAGHRFGRVQGIVGTSQGAT